MTVSEALSYLRNMHNATQDSFWSDMELMALIQAKSNEICSIIGDIEAVDATTVSIANTQTYDYPAEFEFIKRVSYNGNDIQLIDMRDWDLLKLNGTTPTGTPRFYFIWNRQLYLVPTPDTSALVIQIFAEKRQGTIDQTTDTINLPEVLHGRLMDGVIAEMFAKDQNAAFAQMYSNRWLEVHIPAFYIYKQQYRKRGRFSIVKDSDSELNTDFGVR